MAKRFSGEWNKFYAKAENVTEGLKHFLKFNSVKQESKVSFLIAVMGPYLNTTLRNLLVLKSLKYSSFYDI